MIDPPVSKEGFMSRVADPKAKITLLHAAEQVFAERGLVGAKVEEIARRAGVSKGAFYLHFESKEAALKQLVESFLARCQSYFASPSAYPDLPDDPDDLVEFALARDVQMFEFLWQNRAFLRILPTCCQGDYDYLMVAFRAEIAQTTREWVDHWRRQGIFRSDVEPDLAATLIGGAYNELSLKMIQAEKKPPLEAWLRFALETFFRAFGTPELVAVVDRRNRPVSLDIDEAAQRSSAGPRARRPRAAERGRVT
jgi:AcrR family transcriptional regulator